MKRTRSIVVVLWERQVQMECEEKQGLMLVLKRRRYGKENDLGAENETLYRRA